MAAAADPADPAAHPAMELTGQSSVRGASWPPERRPRASAQPLPPDNSLLAQRGAAGGGGPKSVLVGKQMLCVRVWCLMCCCMHALHTGQESTPHYCAHVAMWLLALDLQIDSAIDGVHAVPNHMQFKAKSFSYCQMCVSTLRCATVAKLKSCRDARISLHPAEVQVAPQPPRSALAAACFDGHLAHGPLCRSSRRLRHDVAERPEQRQDDAHQERQPRHSF